MKRIKIVFLIAIMLVLTGCSVEYNLNIDEDSSVSEKVVAKEVTNRMKVNTGLDRDQSVIYLYNMYKRDGLKSNLSSKLDGDNTVATVTGYYESIDEYVNNFSSDIIPEVNITKKGDIVTLKYDKSKVLSSASSRSMIYDDITVKISLPFKVVNSNADSRNGNTYIWKIEKDGSQKEITISYDTSVVKNKKLIKIGKNFFKISYGMVALVIFILLIAITALVVYIKNKKNNKV